MPTELRNRCVSHIFICRFDSLSGFGKESVFPNTPIRRSIVPMIRNSLKFVGWKKRKKVADRAEEHQQKKGSAILYWSGALNRFTIEFAGRMPHIIN